ncbi:MAG: hypothetical protein H7A54_04340 [Akkermansiaceae bacterium]|nr:hypothetical protein [Akkermansiaceae bacterium]
MNSNLTQKQPQKVALLVEGNAPNGLLKVQKVLCHKVLVRHRPLAIGDVDLHLFNLPLQFVLLLRQVLRRREGFPPEVRGIGLANQGKVTLEFLAHLGVLALKLGQLRFQGAD